MEKLNFEKLNGLVPAIVQEYQTGDVLMLGFMNQEALDHTLEEGTVTFYSRTKGRLWKKGETSGNFLRVVSLDVDCDSDAILIQARPAGPVCHTGAASCFPPEDAGNVLGRLSKVIADRKSALPENSYTARLFKEGMARIAQKVGEEAVELSIAAQYPDAARCIEEAADLMYHILVLLAQKGIALNDVYTELEKRMKK